MKRIVAIMILLFFVNGIAGTETGNRSPVTGDGRPETGNRFPSSVVIQKAPDEWIATDKAQHLTASMILTGLAAYRLAHYSDWNRDASLRGGAGFALGLGILKEISDLHKPFPYNRFSLKDLVADLTGIALGVLLLGWW